MAMGTGTKAPTLYDVAALAGVSHQTVARLLRGEGNIRPKTQERIHAAVSELGYRRNVTARNLRNGRTDAIVLAIPDLRQPYFAELAQSAVTAAQRVGLTVLIETTDGDPARELAVLEGARSQIADGVILSPKSIGEAELRRLKVPIPVVLFGDRVMDSAFDHVTLPNVEGTRRAVEHLIGSGRRRIAFIGAEEPGSGGAAALRLDGYESALREAGLPVDESLVVPDGEWVRGSGQLSMARLLDSGVAFDAVFCCNDALAIGALRTMLSRGIRVPEDIAIVGFDDTEDARYTFPSLTSVSPGREQLANEAVQLLHRRINHDVGAEAPVDLVSDFELVVRESSLAKSPSDEFTAVA